MSDDGPSLEMLLDGWELFRDPILCAVIAGAVLGALGVYVVARRMVFVSAAVTQSAAFGVAFALYAEIHLATHVEPATGAVAAALLSAWLLTFDPTRLGLTRESLLGLVFALAGGGAVLLGDRIAQEAHDVQAIVFGTAVLVRPADLHLVVTLGGLVTALQIAGHRGFVFATFDPVGARVQRLPTRLLDAVLLASIGAMAGAATRALGALPVFAFSVLPAVGVLALGLRVPYAFVAAALVGACAGLGGYLVAFFLELPVGASQTAVSGALVLAALALAGAGRSRRVRSR